MQFNYLIALLASAAFVAATPIAEKDDSTPVEKLGPGVVFLNKREACGEGHPCGGIQLTAENCNRHCKEACGKAWGSCGGPFWQICQCHSS